jgi:hypothetical protein
MGKNIIMNLLSIVEKTKGIILTAILLNILMSTGIAHADLTGASVTVEAPQPVAASTFDLVFKMSLPPNDGEFVDRLVIALPAGWMLNALTAPPPNTSSTCSGVAT